MAIAPCSFTINTVPFEDSEKLASDEAFECLYETLLIAKKNGLGRFSTEIQGRIEAIRLLSRDLFLKKTDPYVVREITKIISYASAYEFTNKINSSLSKYCSESMPSGEKSRRMGKSIDSALNPFSGVETVSSNFYAETVKKNGYGRTGKFLDFTAELNLPEGDEASENPVRDAVLCAGTSVATAGAITKMLSVPGLVYMGLKKGRPLFKSMNEHFSGISKDTETWLEAKGAEDVMEYKATCSVISTALTMATAASDGIDSIERFITEKAKLFFDKVGITDEKIKALLNRIKKDLELTPEDKARMEEAVARAFIHY